MEILNIKNLSFRYPETDNDALKNINLSINNGDFIVVCGESGCGKTTLLKLLKRELAPIGDKKGEIYYNGTLQENLDAKTSASEIGFVLQNPDNQIVTDKVWHELAFGLENLGVPTPVIRRRVGEMASYFGIQDWFRKNTDELSGGQKQLLNLASVMVMQPKILILDEPTAQLDPIAAQDFISTLKKLNHELGLTVIMVEHRLEDVFPIADKVLILENGKTLLFDAPENIGISLREDHPMLSGLPTAVRIFGALNMEGKCPLTVKEGRDFLEENFTPKENYPKPEMYTPEADTAIELKNIWFRYEKNLPDVLHGTSMIVYKGEFYCLLGGNGTGKTSTLNVISGLNKAYRGKIFINGKSIKDYKGNALYRNMLAYLPQNPQTVFIEDNIKEDFSEMLEALGVPKAEREDRINAVCERVGISRYLNRHPYDLSGGEQQKCAIAKMLLLEPKILLLDEPTKGLDAHSKHELKLIFKNLLKDGITVLAVTHDVEFAAESADRCALFFDGEILSADTPSKFFAENNFYTTAANRMARSLWKYAVTTEQVINCCKEEKQ